MDVLLPDGLQARIDAVTEAEINSWYESLKERERKESQRRLQDKLQDIELERKRVIEQRLGKRRAGGGDDLPRTPPSPQETPIPSAKTPAARNGSSGLPTRRKMLLTVLPDFGGREFIRRDVEAKILDRWPGAKGSTEAELNNFMSGLAGLLTDLVKKGRLEKAAGKTPFDPPVYRVINNDEDTLLRSGP